MAPSHMLQCLVSALAFICCAHAKTLVLLDSLDLQYTHSLFFRDLRDAGHELEFSLLSSKQLRLQKYGTWLYDSIAILSSTPADFGGALDAKYLVEFVDAGHNVLIAASSAVAEPIREFAAEMGADFLEAGSELRDYVSSSATHSPAHILASHTTDVHAIIPPLTHPVLYKGIGLTTPLDTLLTSAALRAPISTRSVADSKDSRVSGASIVLATAMQTHYNARVSVTGSVDMFSDAFFAATVHDAQSDAAVPTGNRDFCRELALWTFKAKSVLKLSNFRHHREGEEAAPPLSTYTVGDVITLEADIFEKRGGEWVPHVSSTVQAEYVMMDPYVRQAMSHDGRGHYNLTIKSPDVYGVFKWVIDYKSKGLSFLHYEEVAPLRPFRHNEFERFVVQAYPYYTSVVTLSIGFFVMITYTMFHQPRKLKA